MRRGRSISYVGTGSCIFSNLNRENMGWGFFPSNRVVAYLFFLESVNGSRRICTMSRKENHWQDLLCLAQLCFVKGWGWDAGGDSMKGGKCRYRSRRGMSGGIGGRKTKANATGELSHLYPCNALLTWVRTFARRPAVSRDFSLLGLSLPFLTKKDAEKQEKSHAPAPQLEARCFSLSLKAAHVQTAAQPAPSSDFVSTHSPEVASPPARRWNVMEHSRTNAYGQWVLPVWTTTRTLRVGIGFLGF